MIRDRSPVVALLSRFSIILCLGLGVTEAAASSLQFSVADLGSVEGTGIVDFPTRYGSWAYAPNSSFPDFDYGTYGHTIRVQGETRDDMSLLQVTGTGSQQNIRTWISVPPGSIHSGGTPNGLIYDIGSLVGFNEVIAADWNSSLMIVGTMDPYQYDRLTNGDASFRAFLYDHQLLDLNTLIPADFGWLLKSAISIDDNSRIFGWGINPQGERHAFLLTPTAVPEPSTLALLGVGILAMGVRTTFGRSILNKHSRS